MRFQIKVINYCKLLDSFMNQKPITALLDEKFDLSFSQSSYLCAQTNRYVSITVRYAIRHRGLLCGSIIL